LYHFETILGWKNTGGWLGSKNQGKGARGGGDREKGKFGVEGEFAVAGAKPLRLCGKRRLALGEPTKP
jgi:hypothetical protein